ncbi:MAG: glycosyltransferase family 4 protein [Actinobacteria bacterium]|nr:glycosyltransferase family 4 protein [Actinomycetota bacterium]
MNVLIVSGIWPPDVGGPASHAPELAAFLRARGHGVEVVTTAAETPPAADFSIHAVLRSTPVGLRHARVAALIACRARRADVVYATSMISRAGIGSTLARRPLVLKLVADAAYERAKRQRIFSGSLVAFQEARGLRITALRLARDLALRRASHVVCPSAFLRELSLGWGLAPDEVTVLPNAMPPLPELRPPEEVRAELGLPGIDGSAPLLAFAGRINAQKSLDVLLDALAQVDGPSLALVGDGPELARLEGHAAALGLDGRVRFLGARSRTEVLELFHAADASVLTSAWENFPHTVVEALAVGTPVLGTAVGGVTEIVRDGENGLLVPPGQPAAFADALRRYLGDEALRERLRVAAPGSVAHLRPERIYGELEQILARAAGR